jgi:photosystem II stability/assembly factor-like uncharacterized protein
VDTTNYLEDVWFINRNVGYTLTNYSVFQTTDGGNTWQTSANINGGYNIQFVDSLHGFVQGSSFYFSGDGGKSWIMKNAGIGIYFQFLTPEVGFYFNGELYNTQDGGSNWASILKSPSTSTGNYPFYFLDSLTGFSMINGNCYKTRDGGLRWDSVSHVTTDDFNGYYKMQFLDTLNGFSGAPNELLKTIDGGKTWTTSFKVIENNPDIHTFIIPQFFDVNNGYLMTSSGIYKTTNAGKDWTTSCRIGRKSITGMHFIDMNTGWASTTDGYVLRLN